MYKMEDVLKEIPLRIHKYTDHYVGGILIICQSVEKQDYKL